MHRAKQVTTGMSLHEQHKGIQPRDYQVDTKDHTDHLIPGLLQLGLVSTKPLAVLPGSKVSCSSSLPAVELSQIELT